MIRNGVLVAKQRLAPTSETFTQPSAMRCRPASLLMV